MSLETELSEMSDAGRFERVATEVLRWSDHKHESVIQTGINTEGKPIRDPVDGFGQIPDAEPPHYVYLEFTTTQKSGLERKWLANPGPGSDQPKGDLIKAAEEAESIREYTPDAEFTIALVSNRVLDSELLRGVCGTVSALDVSVDVWDVHRLSDFLRTDPNGQYIRKEYFGIDEERLSEPLLLELSDESIRSYKEVFHIRDNEAKVERPELSTIIKRAHSSSMRSYFVPVVGNSGFGKTVICHQAMEKWRDDGNPALRLDADDINRSKSLAQAIESGLTRLQPSLESTAGQTALQLAKENRDLLIVVDDLNRANNPSQLLARLQNWMGGAREDASNGSGDDESADLNGLPVTILCPLWPRIWAKQERNFTQNEFAEIIKLDPLSTELASQLIQSHAGTHGHDLDKEHALELAEKVNRDPHLIGLLGQLMQSEDAIENLPDTSKEVLSEYAEYAYETASEASDEPLIIPDYARAVEELSLDVMDARVMAPAWRQIHEWSQSGSDNLDEVRILSEQEQLFTILNQQAERTLSFRHDRIRDFLLADASFSAIDRTDRVPSCLDDPYYYTILGTGIAFFRPSETPLSKVCDQNPLALLDALRRLGGNAPEYEDEIGTEFQQWLDRQGGYTELPNTLLGETMEILRQTDSNQVLGIAEALPQFPPVLLARFRNGDLEAGIQYCTGNRGGSPDLNNPQRDAVFDDAFQRRGDRHLDQLSEVLSSVDTPHAQGALRLAGFFGRAELGPGLTDCWENHRDDPELLPAFFWATFQCCIPENHSLVNQVVDHWDSLPGGNSIDDADIEFGTGNVFRKVQHALTRDISKNQIEYLIEAVEEYSNVDHYLVSLLSQVSDPDALELVVKKRGENIQEIDGMSPWATTLLDHWSPSHPRGQTLPPESKERMKEVWTEDENIDEIRTSAFQLWGRNAEQDDIEELKRASENDLFEYTSHYYRLTLGDETAICSPSIDFTENDGLLEALPNAWGPKAYDLVNNMLNENHPDDSENLFYTLGTVLFRIPRDDAEQLLDAYWEKVGSHSKFFQAALYIGTPLTEELAEGVYEDSDNPAGLLSRLDMNFGFKTSGRSQLISERHLHSLEPYLTDIQDMDLARIVEKAYELGMEDWATDHVRPHLSEDLRQNHFPTEDDLLEELNEVRDTEEKDIRGWMTRFEQRQTSKSNVFEIMEERLQSDPTVETYKTFVEIVKNWGRREELEILEDVSIEDDRMEQLYEDAEFGVKVRTLN